MIPFLNFKDKICAVILREKSLCCNEVLRRQSDDERELYVKLTNHLIQENAKKSRKNTIRDKDKIDAEKFVVQ